MKFKYILIAALLLFIIGVPLKIMGVPGSSLLVLIGGSSCFFGGLIYVIIALIRKDSRWIAGYMAVAGFPILGYTFKLMHWPGAGAMLVIGLSTLLFVSLGFFAGMLANKHQSSMPYMFLSLGLCALFLQFDIMNWPGANLLFFFVVPVAILAIIMVIMKREKPYWTQLFWAITIIFSVIMFVLNSRQETYLTHISGHAEKDIHPWRACHYAWYCYQDGDPEEGLQYLEIAKENITDPAYEMEGIEFALTQEVIDGYISKIKANNWDERPSQAANLNVRNR